MRECPTPGRLECLLLEELGDAERGHVEAHVEDCAACQEALHHLASGGAGPAPLALRAALSGGPPPETSPEAETFLAQLRRSLALGRDGPQWPASGAGGGGEPPEVEGYEVLEELGRGATGVVYRARHRALNRPVALKIILAGPHLSPEARRRFRLEAQAIARLQHPNIVQVYEVGEHAGRAYLSLELVEGENLARRLGGVPLPPDEAARIVATLAAAVAYAHGQGVIHRDLKPANVLIGGGAGGPGADSGPRRGPDLKITDFGLAKILPRPDVAEERMTESGMVLGTPAYIAPEQARGLAADVGPASDIYSLGAILYELLTGRPPFHGASPMETLLLAAHQEPVPPARLVSRVPRDLDTICLKCLEKEPARRYATAGELAADLGRHLDHEPIRARPMGPLSRLARWGRRNPVPAASLAALVVMGQIAFAAVLWEWRTAERAGASERWERYRSNIVAAAAALQLEQSEAARRALEAAPPEHRGWEWRHLRNQLDVAFAAMPGDAPPIPGFLWQRPIISPSGDRLAIVDRDARAINIWDAATGTAVGALRGHDGPVYALAYSPDGKRLASGSADKTIRLWEPASGKGVGVLRGHEQPVEWLFYSPDGRRIYSMDGESSRLWDADSGRAIGVLGRHAMNFDAPFTPDGRRLVIALDRRLCLYDATTGRELTVLGSHDHPIIRLAIDRDGKRIASQGDQENTVRLWDGATGRPVAILRGHAVSPGILAFSPDGSRLASGGPYPESDVDLWEAATGRPIKVMRGHTNAVQSVDFSPDGGRIVSASLDQTARLWDGVHGEPVATLRGHTDRLRDAIFSPDGRRVATASADRTLRLWDATSGDLVAVLRGHRAEVVGAAFAGHGSLLVSRSGDGETRVWDMELAERNGILRGHGSFVYDVAFSPDGTRVASAAWDGTARIWDATSGRGGAVLRHERGTTPEGRLVSSVAWHPGGGQLATVTRADAITLWDLATSRPRRVITTPTGEWTGDARAAFNPAGTLLASGSRDGTVRLWDVTTGKPAGELARHAGAALDVAFSPDGRRLASVGFDRTVRIWDVATGSAIRVLTADAESYRIAYGAGGRLIAAGSRAGNVRLWDASTYRELPALPHGSGVYGLAFSPDGTRLATGCADNTIRLWDIATLQEVCELRGHRAYVHAVAFSPDGTRLASASGDSTVRIWDTVPPAVRARPPDGPLPPRGRVANRDPGPFVSEGRPIGLIGPPR